MSYGVSKEQLVELNASREESDVTKFEQFGGLAALATKLKTDLRKGLTSAEVSGKRKETFGENVFPEQEPKTIWHFIIEAFEDQTLRILIACAIVSLVFGLFFSHEEGGWVDSVGIFCAIVLVVSVSSFNNWQKENQFRDLNRVKEDRICKVLRNGETVTVQATQLLVGDIVKLDTGDYIPADGFIVTSFGIECDESNLTGEPEGVAKDDNKPFMLAGTQIVEGVGTMIITAVGRSTEWGRTLEKLTEDEEDNETPLEKQLEKVADSIGFLGLSVAILMFIVLAGKASINAYVNDANFDMEFVGNVLKYLVHSVSLVVAAVPEGLPLAVTISLAFSTKKMLKDQNLVRNLAACETMGGATTICSDKTGTLTTNRMTTTEAWIGGQVYTALQSRPAQISDKVVKILANAIANNSTANVTVKDQKQPPVYIGNKTECAMLLLLHNLQVDYAQIREQSHNSIEHIFTFSSDRKRMSTVVRNGESTDSYQIYTKGASEIVSALCDRYVNADGNVQKIDNKVRTQIDNEIERMAKSGLRTICIAYNDLVTFSADNEAPEKNMICAAILGIKDPLRQEVPASIAQCKRSGILVRMVTGDNILTAKHIAQECGIYDPVVGVAMEGPEFRAMTAEQMEAILPRLQVLARSTPSDKHLLVTTLKKMGEVVAVTGDGTNDAAALKAANVGLSMGIAGTEVAKEASDIVIMDDNFASIVKSVLWGRSVYENVRKFLQFQITINIAAVLITFVGSVSERGFPLTAVQLLWVNLIMDTFAALALATEPPSEDLLNRKPHGATEFIITPNMWKNIIVQSALQLAILLPLINVHESFFGAIGTPEFPNVLSNKQHDHDYTLVFNIFVWCQLFNMWNARKINNELNIFENISKSWVFIMILIVTAIGQVAIIEFGGLIGFGTTGLTLFEWAVSIGLGALALPLGFMLRFVPIGGNHHLHLKH